jgi:hypothetical protein
MAGTKPRTTRGGDLHDQFRNTAIALMARVGLSGGQWQRLVHDLIDYQEAT